MPKSDTNPKPTSAALSPAQRAQKLFGDLFGAKKPKDRAEAMKEFASLSPGEQAFVQSELLYLTLLGQERVRVSLQDLSDQLDDSTDALIETLQDLRPRDDDPLGLFDRAEEAEEPFADDVNGEDNEDDEDDEDDETEGDDLDGELELEDDNDNDDHTPEAA
ncbi:hypothetical protein L6R49_12690 [Myxococcota bacterium]|nr:hypothetical protein [Myxococcota bacterium]